MQQILIRILLVSLIVYAMAASGCDEKEDPEEAIHFAIAAAKASKTPMCFSLKDTKKKGEKYRGKFCVEYRGEPE